MVPSSAVAVLAVVLVVGSVTGAHAQSLGTAINNALAGNKTSNQPCAGLQNTSMLGPQLSSLCFNSIAIPNAAGGNTSSGSLSVESRIAATDEERRTSQRLKERREGGGASADMPAALRGLGFFVSAEHGSFDKDATASEPGYGRETWGGTVGVDYSFGGLGVLGLAFSYSNAKGFNDVGGGGFEIDTWGPTLYGSIYPVKNLFLDGYVGYNVKDYASDRRYSITLTRTDGTTINNATGGALGHTGGEEFKAGATLGYDFVLRNLTVGPRLGVNYRETNIQGFTERPERGGPTGAELTFEHQNHTSLTSVVGLFGSYAISTGFGVLVPQVSGEYIHEFENDRKHWKFHFAQDFARTPLTFVTDQPDRDYFMVGGGLVMVLPNGLTPFVNYRELVGYTNQSNRVVTLGLRVTF